MQFSTSLKSLSVGNRIIDFGHQKISDTINDIGQLILVNHVVALKEAIQVLNNCLRDCFASEEKIAQSINFDFTKHRKTHQALSNNFRVITDRLISQSGKLSELERKVCLDTLNTLLIQHIKSESQPFKVVLDTYLYDFEPD